MAESFTEAHDDGQAAPTAVPPKDLDKFLGIWTHLSRGFARTHDARTHYAVDAKGGGRSLAIIRKISANRYGGMATSANRKAT
jgi:hypothetical protein